MTAEPGSAQPPPVPSAPPADAVPREDRRAPLIGFVVSFAILVAILLSALLGYRFADRAIRSRSQAAFDVAVRDIASAIDKRLTLYQDVLHGFQALYAASKSVERNEFKAFSDALKLQHKFPGFAAFEYVEYVPGSERAAFIDRVKADVSLDPSGYPAFDIWPQGERADYLVVTYTEPPSVLPKAHGFDVGSEARRREATERARDSGLPVATMPVTLVIDPDSPQPAFLLFLSIYHNGMPTDTLQGRREALQGYVVGVFRVSGTVGRFVERSTSAPVHRCRSL